MWCIIIGSALLWCIVAICYRRRRARELSEELAFRQAMRERQERERVAPTTQTRTLQGDISRHQRHRQTFVDRNSRQPSVGTELEMLTISVALSREFSGPPSYNEAMEAAAREGSSMEDDPPPPYSSIFDSNEGANPV